jgi:glycosyltransferase involved in cell wall biosynthesis
VELICRRDHILDTWADELASSGCEVHRLDVTRPRDLRRIAGLVRAAAIVHINLAYPSGKYQFTCALLASSMRRPLVVTHQLALALPRRWEVAMRWLGRAAWRHIAASRRTSDFLIEHFDYPPDRVVVIHHGVDADLFRPATQSVRHERRRVIGELLDAAPWGEDVLFTCTVARLSPQKGLFELVDAVQLMAAALPNLRAVVIGEGELRTRLEQEIGSRALQRNLFLAGARPSAQVAEWLTACDLFILPSHYEGGPAIALMEALACGCAAVATSVGGVEEMVTSDSLGRLVPARDAKALAAAAAELLKDPDRRAAMGRVARERVAAEFSMANTVRRTEGVLDEAAHQRRA